MKMFIMKFEPADKMPIIEFFRRELRQDLSIEENGVCITKKETSFPFDDELENGMRYSDYCDLWETLEVYLGILDHDPPCMCDGSENTLHIGLDRLEQMHRHTITIDPEVAELGWNVRRPYYRLRGKPITPGQKKLIEDTVDFDWERPSHMHLSNFSKNFIHENGELYINCITGKYPHIGEYILDGLYLAGNFPFIDLIIAITGWDEVPEEVWESWDIGFEEHRKLIDDESNWDFMNNIDVGIYVHDGDVEILSPKRTAKVYTEYNEKYGIPFHGF